MEQRTKKPVEQQTKKPATRLRSPNYPLYSLKLCMDFLTKFYKKYGSSEAHVDDAVTQMGHSPTSSTAGRVLSSMQSFGLLESRGAKAQKFVRLSRLAQQILLEEDDSERYELLRHAALLDDAMQAVWQKWGTELPHIESLKKSLQLEMQYTAEGAKQFASVIIDTYDFAHMKEKAAEQIEDDTEEEVVTQETTGGEKYTRVTESKKAMRVTNLLLRGANREIVIHSPEDLTDAEFDMALKWLEFQRYGLVNPVESTDKNNGKHQEKPKEKEV